MLRAKRDSSDQLPNGDITLVQPVLDMVFQETAAIGNQTIHLDSCGAKSILREKIVGIG